MAVDFDEFPLDDPIVDANGKIFGDVWRGSLSVFIQSLVGYLSQNGIFVPKLTTIQRNAIQSPEPGQMIYVTNTDVGPPASPSLQVWQDKLGVFAWRAVTTVP